MADRPEEFTDWASDETQVTEPTGGLKATGYSPGDRIPAEYLNWQHKNHDDWAKWLDQETYATRAGRLADALANYTDVSDILSNTHNWHAGAVSNTATNGLVNTRYWVVGDDNAGNTAMAYAQGPNVAGSGWADETGSAQVGSLDRCASSGVYCLGIDTGTQVWKLGGSSNEFGNSGFNILDVIYDPTSNLWVAISGTAIYTSPLTTVAWTQRYTGAITLNCLASYGGRLVCVANEGLLYSDDALTWTAGYVDASANWVTPSAIAANSLGFWITDTATANRIFYTPDGITVTEITTTPTVEVNDQRIVSWSDIICLPGMYMSYDPRVNQWSGATFFHGAAQRLSASAHGAISCIGTENAILFGPTIHLPSVPFAV